MNPFAQVDRADPMTRRQALALLGLATAGCASTPETIEGRRELQRYEAIPPSIQSGALEVRGQTIHYLQQGNGRVVVLLHTFPSSSYEWRHVIPRLGTKYAVYAPDFVGYGKSRTTVGVDRSLAAQVSYVSDWMEAAGIPEAIVIGQGFGGGVAQMLAVKYPRRVTGLVLVNSVCFDSWPNSYARLLAEPGWGKFTGGFFARDPGIKSFLKQAIYYQDLLTEGVVRYYTEPWVGSDGRRDLHLAAQSLRNDDTQALASYLGRIRVPSLVIAGRFDPFQHINYSRRLAGAIPGAQFIAISSCGHIASEDEPEKIYRYVYDFFQ